jgi:hypothetical protein
VSVSSQGLNLRFLLPIGFINDPKNDPKYHYKNQSYQYHKLIFLL